MSEVMRITESIDNTIISATFYQLQARAHAHARVRGLNSLHLP
jgi:hypothetical protein